LYSEIPEQVIFKLYLARVQIVSVPEVTSMQVFECIGEEWNSPLQISLFVYLGEFKGCDWPPIFAW
jgi:hypothetical protein